VRHRMCGVLGLVAALLCAAPALAQPRCDRPIARIVSSEGDIAVTPAMGTMSVMIAFGAQVDICAGESIQAGGRSRAAVLLLNSNQLIRLDQNTTIIIRVQTPADERSAIELLRGLIRLFNPAGRALDVRTPFVTAGTEGTEFFVRYENQDTTAGVMEGVLRLARNADQNTVLARLGAGEAARVPPAGPVQRLDIRPEDAVRWAIYYPPATWSLPAAEEAMLDPRVARAWQDWRSGNFSEFPQDLNAIPPQAPLDAASLLRFAALLLGVGQVDEAAGAIARAEAMNPAAPMVPALRSVIAVARNETADALAFSERAVNAARAGGSEMDVLGAAVVRSYALQSAFRLPEARDVLATASASNDPLVLARLAEIELSLGNSRRAREMALRASQGAPVLSRPLSILGFAALADFQFAAARTAFDRAAVLAPGDPLPRLGLGLGAIRARDLAAGRRELAIAVALDPENSVARSYFGRSYAEGRLYDNAFREWRLAEAADPRDPTAPLYRAFALRALNRPADALRDIETSIALNQNRAVYRSRLLLDQDLATRTTGLGAIYRDLGFEQLALSEGHKSVAVDPANPAAHRFLSDSYLSLPRHETASDSELLQALLLQPLNVQPVRPRLAREGLGILDLQGPSRVGFNEFSPLFAADGVTVLGDGFGGNRGTYGENLAVNGIHQNLSGGAGQFYYRTEGIRPNNQLRRDIETALFQGAVSGRLSVLAEFRHSALTSGDTQLLFDPENFSTISRNTAERTQYRLGGRFETNPGLTLVAVWTHEHRTGALTQPAIAFDLSTKADGDFAEGAVYVSRQAFNVVLGGGYFEGQSKDILTFGPLVLPLADTTVTHANGWVYANASPVASVHATLGASYDHVRGTPLDRDRLNPKLGLRWEPVAGSSLRAAYVQTVKRTVVGGQTIEPTQVAGFNQLFDDDNATTARLWGLGFDQRLMTGLFAGVEWSQRRLEVPITEAAPPFATVDATWKEEVVRPYLNWILTDRVALNLAPQWERFTRDPTALFNPESFSDLDLLRLPVELRYFDPSGLFGFLRASYVDESGHFLDAGGTLFRGQDSFTVVDAGIGWRLPGRPLMVTAQAKNLFNSSFRFQDTDPNNPAFIPRRLLLGRVTFSF
jgi:tetratricopeptide (TPR) repeat protein